MADLRAAARVDRTTPLTSHPLMHTPMVPDTPVLERSTLRDVEAALDPLRRKQRDLQTFLASQLERLEMQAGEVERREQAVAEKAAALAKERVTLDEEWAHFDELVETARAHALEIHEEKQRLDAIASQHTDSGRRNEVRRLSEALENAEREREALEAELATAQRKVGQLTDVSLELAEARTELDRLRNESCRTDAAMTTEWQRKLAAVEIERDRLNSELQSMRQRVSELSRDREEERKRYAQERTEWLDELRSMRRSLKSTPAEPADPPPAPRNESRPPPRAAAPDGALEAMLHQFEAVKRDSARHRSTKP